MIVCFLVAIFSKFLITSINEYRSQKYREDIANGVFYVIAEGIAHQDNEKQREYWLSDASNLFGEQFTIHPVNSIEFTHYEQNRLNNKLAVVRFDKYQIARVFYPLPDEKSVISVKMSRVDEQQVRALAIFLLDDLSYYPTFEKREQRLAELSKIFPFKVSYRHMSEITVDKDQLNRLRRNEVVVVFNDSAGSADSTSIRVLVPSELIDMIIEMGPLPLFKWFPLELIVYMALLSMFLISLGVYTLILPLERKLLALQSGLNDVSEGKLDTRLIVKGRDETAKLSATFNAMAEHIKRLIESQRELTRAVSHELRTPVARIRFAVDMLADTDEYESRCSQRDYIDADIEELNELIDEILTYAKLEEGSPKLDWEMVDLKEMIQQITKESNALGKAIRVTYDMTTDKKFAEADKRYLHRVVQNLAGNALRYAESNILVSAGINKDVAFVCVEDDGHGIAEKDRDKVFVPFTRLDDSRTRASGGYGLGLSIVSRICFWFNGSMSVEESSMGGAKFTMKWPVKQITQTISANNLTQQTSKRKMIDS